MYARMSECVCVSAHTSKHTHKLTLTCPVVYVGVSELCVGVCFLYTSRL